MPGQSWQDLSRMIAIRSLREASLLSAHHLLTEFLLYVKIKISFNKISLN